jgi:DNA-binding transcriptional ArsR family regulator
MSALSAVDVIEDSERAAALLSPMRLQLVESLREPDSAAGVARKLGLPRQKVHYHLRELERAGLVEVLEERRKGNVVERILRATATHYMISPSALGPIGSDPDEISDRFSFAYLVAVAAKTISDLATLRKRADAEEKRLATFALQVDVRFGSSAACTAFTEELANKIAELTAKYHDEASESGRSFHYTVGAYPTQTGEVEEA